MNESTECWIPPSSSSCTMSHVARYAPSHAARPAYVIQSASSQTESLQVMFAYIVLAPLRSCRLPPRRSCLFVIDMIRRNIIVLCGVIVGVEWHPADAVDDVAGDDWRCCPE